VLDKREDRKRLLLILYFVQFQKMLLWKLNPLYPELNFICHLLVLLGDLTFMSPCIVSIFQYISNEMQR